MTINTDRISYRKRSKFKHVCGLSYHQSNRENFNKSLDWTRISLYVIFLKKLYEDNRYKNSKHSPS